MSPNDLPDFTTQTSESNVVANDVTIVGGQGGAVNVGVALEPYLIGSFTTTSLATQTSPAMTLKTGTHAALVIEEGTAGSSNRPNILLVQSNTKNLEWPLQNIDLSSIGNPAPMLENGELLGVVFLTDAYDPSVVITVQENNSFGNTYKLYGILDTSVVFPDTLSSNPLTVAGSGFVNSPQDFGVLSVQGIKTTGSASPIIVKGNGSSGELIVKGLSGGTPVTVAGATSGTPTPTPSGTLAGGTYANGATILAAPPSGKSTYITAISIDAAAADSATVGPAFIAIAGVATKVNTYIFPSPLQTNSPVGYAAQTVNQNAQIFIWGYQQ